MLFGASLCNLFWPQHPSSCQPNVSDFNTSHHLHVSNTTTEYRVANSQTSFVLALRSKMEISIGIPIEDSQEDGDQHRQLYQTTRREFWIKKRSRGFQVRRASSARIGCTFPGSAGALSAVCSRFCSRRRPSGVKTAATLFRIFQSENSRLVVWCPFWRKKNVMRRHLLMRR